MYKLFKRGEKVPEWLNSLTLDGKCVSNNNRLKFEHTCVVFSAGESFCIKPVSPLENNSIIGLKLSDNDKEKVCIINGHNTTFFFTEPQPRSEILQIIKY